MGATSSSARKAKLRAPRETVDVAGDATPIAGGEETPEDSNARAARRKKRNQAFRLGILESEVAFFKSFFRQDFGVLGDVRMC